MKKVLLLLAIAIGFASCEGDQGPPGFDGLNGLNGLDGSEFEAQFFEATLDFEAPDYSNFIVYPNDILTAPDDMTLVYILYDQVSNNNGGTVDVWRLLPQTLYTDFGEFQYNFDFTADDATIFLDGPDSTDFTQLTAGDLENQTFRIVILPLIISSNPNLDVTDYNAVMELANLNDDDLIQLQD